MTDSIFTTLNGGQRGKKKEGGRIVLPVFVQVQGSGERFNGSDEIRRNAGIKQGIQGDGSFSHVDRIQFGVSLG